MTRRSPTPRCSATIVRIDIPVGPRSDRSSPLEPPRAYSWALLAAPEPLDLAKNTAIDATRTSVAKTSSDFTPGYSTTRISRSVRASLGNLIGATADSARREFLSAYGGATLTSYIEIAEASSGKVAGETQLQLDADLIG